jgi:hypothetical protein
MQTSLFSHDPTLNARQSDPVTSKRSAARIRPAGIKASLLAAYAKHPLTDEQAAAIVGVDLYMATKRCSDLRRDLLVEPIGFRPGASGSDRMLCAITETGRAALSKSQSDA